MCVPVTQSLEQLLWNRQTENDKHQAGDSATEVNSSHTDFDQISPT